MCGIWLWSPIRASAVSGKENKKKYFVAKENKTLQLKDYMTSSEHCPVGGVARNSPPHQHTATACDRFSVLHTDLGPNDCETKQSPSGRSLLFPVETLVFIHCNVCMPIFYIIAHQHTILMVYNVNMS
ncbi:Protein of unknown function [Gryllus bimaculatus]|nr:Protein of unknown function [Gryllus bimaculatus]